jgi:hypothetical protein
MKPMADGAIPKNGLATGMECLRYALSRPTSVVITGCENMDRLEQALQAVRTFEPLTPDQVSGLHSRTREAALSGKYEGFKTTSKFDSTASHPQWLG